MSQIDGVGIIRKFKNIKTNRIEIFDEVVKPHITMPLGGIGFEKITPSTIAIVLGEPASGKTYQLKEYEKNNEKCCVTDLIALKDTDTIDDTIDVVLIDSIDEALTQSNNKKIVKGLKEYILRCKDVNSTVRFVITCRHLEWNEYFKNELKSIDKELRIYSILPLDKEDINCLLQEKSIEENKFWTFIEENYLEPLLGNIIIIQHLIDEFETYRQTSVNYTTIYKNIVKKNLAKKGDDRESRSKDIPLDEMTLIVSSLATYMLLNRKDTISASDLEFVASKLYKINSRFITHSDLTMVLNTDLFKKVNSDFSFIHKSIQEYLTAYFINYKNLDEPTIKKLFAHKLRFLEKYEEVIIYLTNMNEELHEACLNFDPFIFRRHPTLNRDQQEKLLLSVLNKLKNEEYKLYGKWKYLDGTTIVRYKELTNLTELTKNNIKLSDINLLTFTYLVKLLEFNYSEELEDYIFEILESVGDKRKYITYSFINNYDFNFRLLPFLYKHDLLETDLYTIHSFETRLFQSLYGIEFKFAKEAKCDYTNIDFEELLNLLEYVPANEFKYIVPYLQNHDITKWFAYMQDNFDEKKYNTEYLTWFISALLQNKINMEEIIGFLTTNKIFTLHFHSKDIKFSFKEIDSYLWEIFFQSKKDFHLEMAIEDILSFYTIEVEDVTSLTEKYPIKDFPECYIHFRMKVENIDDFLMKDGIFKRYMENIWEKQRKQEEEWEEESKQRRENSPAFKQIELRDKLCEDSKKLDSQSDFYQFFFCFLLEDKTDEINSYYTEEKKLQFIEVLKKDFLNDITYLELKKDLISSSLSNNSTFMFAYLFDNLTVDEIFQFLNTKELYRKLFWHLYRYMDKINEPYFIKLSAFYFDEFIELMIESIAVSLQQSSNKSIGKLNQCINVLKNLNKFDKDSINKLIQYILTLDKASFKTIEIDERTILLDILALDKNNFDFIKELMLLDEENCHAYLSALIKIDSNLAIEYFNKEIYNKISQKLPVMIRIKSFFGQKTNIEINKYDNPKINPQKINQYKCFLTSITNGSGFDYLESNFIEMILSNYYEFFKDYEQLDGFGFMEDTEYSEMNEKINALWTYLENTTKHLEVIKKLTNSKIKRLSNNAYHSLEKIYNLENKEKNYSNSYYKDIFNNGKSSEGNTSIIVQGNVYGSVIDKSKNKKVIKI